MANKSSETGASSKDEQRPPQQQDQQPGREGPMRPAAVHEQPCVRSGGRLEGRVALITGGDSGIGRATACAFAREGADVMIVYLDEDKDAQDCAARVKELGRRCEIHRADVGDEAACRNAVAATIGCFGKLDILVNNAAEQHPQESILEIGESQLMATFRTNVFAMFFLSKAALPHLRKSEGASTFPPDKVASFGADTPLGRAGEPWECAGCFVFLASPESSYMTGQTLHPNGGEIING